MSPKILENLYLSKTGLVVLAINCLAFGACLTMLALGASNGPSIIVTIGTGLSTTAGFFGIYFASKTREQDDE